MGAPVQRIGGLAGKKIVLRVRIAQGCKAQSGGRATGRQICAVTVTERAADLANPSPSPIYEAQAGTPSRAL